MRERNTNYPTLGPPIGMETLRGMKSKLRTGMEGYPDPLATSVGPSFTARKRSSRRKKDEISISKKRRT
jgi:hypothetical protein